MLSKISQISLLGFIFLFFQCNVFSQEKINTIKINNLKAFAKLYGYVRFFHPSDEASQINWDNFALYGVKEILTLQSESELLEKLETLFLPIAPSLKLIKTGTDFRYDTNSLIPPNKENFKPIFWQHQGVRLIDEIPDLYKSIRVNRELKLSKGYCKVEQFLDVSSHKGKNFRLKVKGKNSSKDDSAYLWVMGNNGNDRVATFFHEESISENKWSEYQIEGVISSYSKYL